MTTNEKILKSYDEGKYHELLGNLDKSVDELGNTILHHMAQNLDKDAFESLKKMDRKCFTYAIINKANKHGDTPHHLALRASENGKDASELLDYLFDECGANPNATNKDGMAVTIVKDPVAAPNRPKDDTDFIAKLTHYYTNVLPHQNVKGGYSGTRIVHSKLSDVTDSDFSQEGGKRDPESTDMYNQILEKIMKVLKIDKQEAGLYRTALKKIVTDKDPELRKGVNDAKKMQAIDKLLGDDKNAKKVLNGIPKTTIDALRDWLSEQESKRPRQPKKEDTKEEKKTKKPKVTKPKVNTDSENKASFKRNGRRHHQSEHGYLHDDEIIFSHDGF